MTDRYNSLTVVLDRDIRDDDAEAILNAIRCIKGVIDVTGNVVDHSDYVAEQRANQKWREKLYKLLQDESK